ncbi:hypothetical protein K1719_020321 [Acacia pycnantha]|nr:hypothetical protein K1719_020321 [Acacia pycnantha]
MDPSGNSAGGETPPSSQNQTQLHWPGQTHITANNELHIMNEPSLTLHNAGGRRAPPSRSRPLEIEEPRQPPLGTNQESHIINEQIPPPHHAANGRGAQPSPSSQRQLTNREQGLKDKILQIQHLLQRINQEYHTIMKTSPSLYSAGQIKFLQDWTNKLLQQDLEDQLLQCQHALRVHQESHTMKKPSSSSEDRRGGVVTRSCANCNNTSTTQWRSDPTGQKSLCNAWGIRLNREEETRAASGLPLSNLSSAALRRHLEEQRNSVQFAENVLFEDPLEAQLPDPSEVLVASMMEEYGQSLADRRTPDNNPFVPENNFLRYSSGLQSSNVVSPPPQMSPPASSSLANRSKMNPPGNSTGGETPPSSENQTQLQWPAQQTIIANNESHIMNEPSLPLHDAGGTRAPPWWPQRHEEPRQTPIIANQESHIINEPSLPPHRATDDRRTPPSLTLRLGIGEPHQTPHHHAAHGRITPPSSENQTQLQWPGQQTLIANNESHIMTEPSLPLQDAGGRRAPPWWSQRLEEPRQTPIIANQESHIINEPSLPPHRATDDRRTPPSLTLRLGIGKPHQTPRIANQECQIINPPFQPPHHHAAHGRITPPSPSSQRQLGIQEPEQPASRVNNGSLTIQPSRLVYFAGLITELQALDDKLLDMLSKRYKLLQNLQHALRVNQESHTIKKPSRVNQESHTMKKPPPPSSSEGWRGGVVALRCAKCKNTSTTQWRSDPTGQKSLCNACWNRLNREEETRAASGLRSSNIVLPPGMSYSEAIAHYLLEARDRMENNANPFVPENNFLGPSPGLQSSNIVSPPPGISYSEAMTRYLQQARDGVGLMENNANPFVPENNFLGHSSGLQSSNIVSLPPEMSPPAAPSLANSVQLVENISGLQSSSPLRDQPVVASKMEEFRQNPTDKSDKTPDNSHGA